MLNYEIQKAKQFLILYEYFTSEELEFIDTEKDLNYCIYARYAMHDFEQLIHEDRTEQNYKDFLKD